MKAGWAGLSALPWHHIGMSPSKFLLYAFGSSELTCQKSRWPEATALEKPVWKGPMDRCQRSPALGIFLAQALDR